VPTMRLQVVAMSVDVAYFVRRRLQKHWVKWGFVSLDHWNVLHNISARVHTFVTMAQFQLLHDLPLPWSCHFLTQHWCCPQSVHIHCLV